MWGNVGVSASPLSQNAIPDTPASPPLLPYLVNTDNDETYLYTEEQAIVA
ncbi:MAG TPA: hypothetical protein VF707_07985 [Ardenticatenaceae bacterium]|jgi:hypothetical protein